MKLNFTRNNYQRKIGQVNDWKDFHLKVLDWRGFSQKTYDWKEMD